ncbi:succinate dehydrogenase, cytochrome b556 subunit [Sandaracinobacteroides saxicola]|nr:succinate dehydrogenase, cytochrome b556 subunit [Sandaracinobacteroides saxicola]
MAASIFHRVSGNALAFGALLLFGWWLFAAASGKEAYATFHEVATGWFGMLVGVGLSWMFWQHLLGGVRHLVMDGGTGYDLKTSKTVATLVFVGAAVMTALTWALILMKGN